MAKRVLLIAAILIVAGFLYVGYTTYDAGRTGANGDVYSTDSNARTKRPTASSPEATPESKVAAAIGGMVIPPSDENPAASTATDQVPRPGTSSSGMAPAADTIRPNPPNGMVFSGTGRFQLYRQGNLTWRLNTDTGQSCVLFATDEEWKKARVLNAGCGQN